MEANAGFTLGVGNNNVYIDNPGNGDESLTMRLGSAQTSTFIAGVTTASVSDAAVMIDTTTGQLGHCILAGALQNATLHEWEPEAKGFSNCGP
jgi:hypothetical protein